MFRRSQDPILIAPGSASYLELPASSMYKTPTVTRTQSTYIYIHINTHTHTHAHAHAHTHTHTHTHTDADTCTYTYTYQGKGLFRSLGSWPGTQFKFRTTTKKRHRILL